MVKWQATRDEERWENDSTTKTELCYGLSHKKITFLTNQRMSTVPLGSFAQYKAFWLTFKWEKPTFFFFPVKEE